MCATRAGLEVVHHQAMFYPTEITVSLWISIVRVIGHVPDEDKGLFRKLIELVLGLVLVLVFVLVDVPTIFFLRWIGRSGHQTLVARRPV